MKVGKEKCTSGGHRSWKGEGHGGTELVQKLTKAIKVSCQHNAI